MQQWFFSKEVSMSDLTLQMGARLVEEAELADHKVPHRKGRWYPIAHHAVLMRVKEALREAGYEVQKQQLALDRDDKRFFGTLDLATNLASGVYLAVCVRNIVDRWFPLCFRVGWRVYLCDNLAYRSELFLAERGRGRYGEQRLAADIAEAVSRLGSFREVEGKWLRVLMEKELRPEAADSFILRAFETGIVGAHDLPAVIREWRRPSFEEFEERTAWSLLNAFTSVLRDRAKTQPECFVLETMRLNALLAGEMDFGRET
jgi:hypothetical protein